MGVLGPSPAVPRIELAGEPEFNLSDVTVQPAERAVVVNGVRRELQPRVMRVLIALAQARPAVVSRDRLIERCWDGRVVGDDALNRCILALRRLARDVSPEPFAIETVPRIGYRLIERDAKYSRTATAGENPWATQLTLVLLAAALSLAILVAVSTRWMDGDRVPTVLVTATTKDSDSQALARDLATKLGSLQSVQSTAMRLVGELPSGSEPRLIMQVKRLADPAALGASVVLTAAPESTILWSKDFEAPSRKLGDLNQQIAFTAAQVLGCAVEGMASEDQLGEPALKLYLNACAALADSDHDPRQTVRMLENVVATSPGFVGGWAKLLAAETDAAFHADLPEGVPLRPALARHIVSARQLRPDLAEAYIAEYILAPRTDFSGRSRILDKAVATNPHHAGARSARARFLLSVGRVDRAVRDARAAVRIDPLSPALREYYLTALAYDGQLDMALKVLNDAERLWPGATSIAMGRFRLHLRFADPREALRLVRSGAVETPRAKSFQPFLDARINPTPGNIARAIRQGRMAVMKQPGLIYDHAQVLAEFDHKEELLDILLKLPKIEHTDVLFRPAFDDLHKDRRFMLVADRVGLLNYWRTSGKWPDFCFSPDLPYDCQVEGTKIGG